MAAQTATALNPAGRARSHPRHWTDAVVRFVEPVSQVAMVAVAALTYFGVRGLTEADQRAARAHAGDVLRFERWLGLDIENRLQEAVIGHHTIVTAMNWVYIWGHWPVIATTLGWLYRSDRSGYRLLRNAMFVSGAACLPPLRGRVGRKRPPSVEQNPPEKIPRIPGWVPETR